jgi:hypothetical protein
MMATWLLPLVLAGGTTGAGSADEDLAVVKKAVEATPRAERRSGKEPQWLRVRVVEKSGKKVSVNLPLALVRALGDDAPISFGCRHPGKERVRLTLGEVLRALDSGQDLVQVDEGDATVRVWVD